MFFNCTSLKQILFSDDINKVFSTNKVKNMSFMFYGCSSLEYLDIKIFDTFNVINMYRMFNGCSELKKLDINNFKTSNVIDMRFMF